MAAMRKAGPSAREMKSSLPEPIPGEAFDLLRTLKRCTCMLSMDDAAKLLGTTRMSVWRAVKVGKIPSVNIGIHRTFIDPALWARQIELRNPHIQFTMAARRRAA
jgi:hypothetical protein